MRQARYSGPAPALGLKRRGRELTGLCPGSGGTDRFRVHLDDRRAGQFFCCRCCPDGTAGAGSMRRFVLRRAALFRPPPTRVILGVCHFHSHSQLVSIAPPKPAQTVWQRCRKRQDRRERLDGERRSGGARDLSRRGAGTDLRRG